MTVFIVACAVLAIASLLWIGRPLWQNRRDEQTELRSLRETNKEALEAQLQEAQQEYAAGRLDAAALAETERELATRLLEEGEVAEQSFTQSAPQPLLFGSLALLVMAATVGLYLDLGQPNAEQQKRVAALKTPTQTEMTAAEAEARVAELRTQLERQAQDLAAWTELARLERRLSDTAAASRSYQHAIMLATDDDIKTNLQLEMVETLALHAEQQGGGIPPVASSIVSDVLSRHPEHPRALWYGSMLAEGAGDRALAVNYIKQLLALNPPEQIQAALAQQLAAWESEAATFESAGDTVGSSKVENARTISVEVDIRNGVDVGNTNAATLFVYARPTDGSKMPLAVWREESPVFPLTAKLDDSMAMMPGTQLGAYDELEIVARISFTGNAISTAGDWFGTTTIGAETSQLTVQIDQLVE